tara:strand:+ start:4349 stop:12184 length:7836 start_codon:yes stop_codon:yes gene_type:complete
MAEQQNTPKLQDTSSIDTDIFIKGMTKDPNISLVGKEQWTHARNAINNSADGDVGTLGNEQANYLCDAAPFTIIGAIHLYGDKWVLYSTNNEQSEIGTWDDSECKYQTLVNDYSCYQCEETFKPCLNFNTQHLITGASKENFDCTWQVYWDDAVNPSRTLNIDNIPWVQVEVSEEGADCVIYENAEPLCLDCEKIRLAPLIDTPCIEISKSPDGGMLRNGSYQVFIAYVINDQTIGDYYGISNVQPLWDHEDTISGLDIKLSNLDKGFDYFELVICSNNQMETQAKKIGIYSTEQEFITIDYINQKLPVVPIEVLPLRNPAYERSDNMYVVNDYLIRQGPTEQFDFNYQPLANQIHVHWSSWQFPADYYKKGGSKPTFMRDEVYAFFIRFIYNTGEKSSSYHIPGRAPDPNGFTLPNGTLVQETDTLPGDPSEIGATIDDAPVADTAFEIYNTAHEWWDATTSTQYGEDDTNDGGVKILEGHMAYWQSSEKYPNDPVRYGELCGKYIRHHKFPDETLPVSAGQNGPLDRSSNNNQNINLLAVNFSNIQWPRYNAESTSDDPCEPLDPNPTGDIIPNIVGYEILVGSREGNKSIIAKGISRNMRQYDIPNTATGHEDAVNQIGVIPNYPFNDCGEDPYLSSNDNFTYTDGGGTIQNADPYPASYTKEDIFTFHSPETSFNKPFLNPYEIKSYGVTTGTALGQFIPSEKHPQQKLLRNISMWIGIFVGIGYAINETRGKRNKKLTGPRGLSIGYSGTGQEIGGGNGQSGSTGTLVWGSGFLSQGTIQPNSGGDFEAGAPSTEDTNINIDLGENAATGQNEVFDEMQAQEELLSTATFGGITKAAMRGVPGGVVNGYEQSLQNEYGEVTSSDAWNKGFIGGGETTEFEGSRYEGLPTLLQGVFGIFEFMQFTATGGQEIIDLIYNLVSFQDYAYKYNGHGLYYRTEPIPGNIRHRTRVDVARYVGNTMQQLNANIKINNIQRPATVAILTDSVETLEHPGIIPGTNLGGNYGDDSKKIIGQVKWGGVGQVGIWYRPSAFFKSTIAAHYTALKVKFENQYGQLDQINQIPVRGCVSHFSDYPLLDEQGNVIPFTNENVLTDGGVGIFKTPSLFGGDCYLNRYTEKVIMPFFWDFLKEQPDGFPYDYRLRSNVPRPIYWMNSQKYDLSILVRSITSLNFTSGSGNVPSNLFSLDRDGNDTGDDTGTSGSGPASPPSTVNGGDSASFEGNGGKSLFHIKNGYMYTHSSGINDFFVESEINTALRDYEDVEDKRHYDWMDYTDVNALFHADIIRKGNFYKYDPSLSKNRFFSQLISFGLMQPRDYDPIVSANCFQHYPKRLIYSLQAQLEAKKDFWRVFLPNNYKDFKNKVNVIKPVSKSGAIILFPNLAPAMFQGVDQLQTDLGTKLTIGDGGLFSQPMQNITNADEAHEYGSCESQRSVVNTPSGLFYISQAQGKIFQYSGSGLVNIANLGMKQWFNKYLPSNLLANYPGIEDCQNWIDNPVAGVGCQTIYDPNFDIVYFCKKDYEPLVPECIDFIPCEGFVYNNTACNGTAPRVCCPPDKTLPDGSTISYVYNPSNPEGQECELITTQPAIETVIPPEIDIVIAVEASEIGKDDELVIAYSLKEFLVEFANQLSSELASGQVQLGLVYFGSGRSLGTSENLSTGQIQFAGGGTNLGTYANSDPMFEPGEQLMLTSNSGDINNWITTKYTLASTNQSQFPRGTSIIAGVWSGLNLLYGTNSRTVPKKLITLFRSPQSSMYNTAYPNDPTTLSSAVDVYQNMTVFPQTPDSAPPIVNADITGTTGGIQTDVTNIDSLGNPGPLGWGNPTSNLDQWFSNNVLNNANYSDLETFSVLVNPYVAGDPAAYTPAEVGQSWMDYADNLADSGNSYYGAYPVNTGDVGAEVTNILNGILTSSTSTWDCANPNCDLIQTSAGQYMCECTSYLPAIIQDDVIPVNLTDKEYFKDVSWTVSYDPKSKAWISFHDWHPDLVVPSLNHFFTTKNYIDESDPQCPPGFTYNPSTMTCCQSVQNSFLADVNIEEVPVEVSAANGVPDLDIVIVVDRSSSMNSLNAANQAVLFVKDFITASQGDMLSGRTQIALASFAGYSSPVNTVLKQLTNDPLALETEVNSWLTTSNFFSNQGNSYNRAVVEGVEALDYIIANPAPGTNSDGNLYLGDRQNEACFKRILIVLSDSSDSCTTLLPINMDTFVWNRGTNAYTTPNPKLNIDSYSMTVRNTQPPDSQWFDSTSCLCGDSSGTPATIGVNSFISWVGSGFVSNAWNNDPITGLIDYSNGNVAEVIRKLLCGGSVCSCPPGFTRVSRLTDGTAPPYTILGPGDNCTTVGQSGVCRKIECECNTENLNDPSAIITTTGECDNIALAYDPSLTGGDQTYINPLPLTCHYDGLCCIDPTYDKGGLWKHNDRCDLYANYYDKNHPWEVEWVESVGQTVNTIRSVEYQLESYIYKGNLDYTCGDRFHDLDWNFDEAIIHNTEQVSGLLKLNLDPKNNVPLITQYPQITGNDIQILYSKEEQKYRFNQFWDITKNRGEFDPNFNSSIFITQLNGYIRDLNQANLNYFKPEFQRKKFRHYWNSVILRKNISSNRKMLLKLANTKINMSFR